MTSIFIKTFGCSLNSADSETIAALLEKAQFTIVDSPEEADIIIINSCTVKDQTQAKFFTYLKEMEKLQRPIIIAGCIASATPELVEGYPLIGTKNLDEIVSVVEETLNGNTVVLIAESECERLSLPSISKNKVIEILPIAEGCLGECTYCIVRQARGKLKSYSPELIIERARKAVMRGAKEIWLTAQDTGCYGKDLKSKEGEEDNQKINLATLIKSVAAIEGEFWIRIGMMNPTHAKNILPELIEAFKNKKVFKFLHIPIQSGDDEILKKMKRHYNVKDFKDIISEFKKEIPSITIATDIICGFPTETKEQFDASVNLIKEIKPDVLNRSRYGARPKTEAAEMEQIQGDEIKRRSSTITSAFEWLSYERNKKWRNWKGQVIVDEIGKEGTVMARNICYKPIAIEGNYKVGDKLKVEIVNNTIHHLVGVVAK